MKKPITPRQPGRGLSPTSKVTALYREATTHWAAQRTEPAIAAFREIVRVEPRSPDAQHNLGAALFADGQISQAAQHLERAVALRPGYEAAWQKLASAFEQLGREVDAANAYEQLTGITKDPVEKRLHRAVSLNLRNAIDEAEAELRRALAVSPNNSTAQGLLGQLLLERGRFAEAEDHLLRAIDDFPAVFQQLTTARRMEERDRPLLERMSAMAAHPEANPFQRASIYFGLGKGYDDLGDYEKAMRFYDAATAERGRSARLDRAGLVQAHNRTIRSYPCAKLPAEVPASHVREADDETPILILGMPRSGTTLVEQIISSHSEVSAAGELSFWRDREQAWRNAENTVAVQPSPAADPLRAFLASRPAHSAAQFLGRRAMQAEIPIERIDRDALEAAGREYVALLRQIGAGARRVTDKALFNFERIGLIRSALPAVRIIHCRREPVDTCLSIYFTNYKGRQSWSKEDVLFQYRQYERLMDHWRATLAPDRFTEVAYAHVIADKESQSRRLIAFCGLDWEDACLAPERNTRIVKTASVWQARQPTYTRSLERWRHYEPWLGPLSELVSDRA